MTEIINMMSRLSPISHLSLTQNASFHAAGHILSVELWRRYFSVVYSIRAAHDMPSSVAGLRHCVLLAASRPYSNTRLLAG